VVEDGTSLALFRIAMGLSVWATVGTVVFGGLVPVLWVDEAFGGYRQLGSGPWLVSLLGGPSPAVIWPLAITSLVTGALMVLGIGGRVTAVLCLLATGAVLDVNGHAGGSYDELLSNALWLVVLAGGDATLSVRAWWRTGQWWPEVPVLAFPRWLALWQLALMYGTTGLQKVSAYWVPGGDASALYYILQQPTWQRFDMSWVAWVYPLTQVSTTITWFWEVLAPLWVLAVWYAADPERPGAVRSWFNRLRVRTLFAVTGLVMHAVIFVTMDVGPFSVISVGFYVCTVHPWEWRQLYDRLAKRRTGAVTA
jgi:hypothetical protein